MQAILDLPEARQLVKRWSVEEYERLTALGAFGRNEELIRGIVMEKARESPLHRYIAHTLYDLLSSLGLSDYFILHEAPLRLDDSVPEPDVSVIRGKKSDYRDKHPSNAALIIEVAVSGAALDRATASLYATCAEEYWIVQPKQKLVEVYRKPISDAYSERLEIVALGILKCGSVPGIAIDLAVLFT